MGHPRPSLHRSQVCGALSAVLDRLAAASTPVDYRLVGTGAALLHGVELPAADVDLLVRRREDVDALAAALAPFRCLAAPEWLPGARQYYGNYDVHGVEVGISTVEIETDADTFETFGPGPWEHYALLPCGSYTVPTVALELRLITELYRDRPDRCRPIIRHLQAVGCDLALIRRGMDAAGLPEPIQKTVLGQLRAAPNKGSPVD